MNLALDFNQTITENPKVFRHLARAILKDGGKVYIISAIEKYNEHSTMVRIRNAHIPNTEVILVFYENYNDIPKLKLPYLKAKRIDLFIDDNPANRQLAIDKIPWIYCMSPEQMPKGNQQSKSRIL